MVNKKRTSSWVIYYTPNFKGVHWNEGETFQVIIHFLQRLSNHNSNSYKNQYQTKCILTFDCPSWPLIWLPPSKVSLSRFHFLEQGESGWWGGKGKGKGRSYESSTQVTYWRKLNNHNLLLINPFNTSPGRRLHPTLLLLFSKIKTKIVKYPQLLFTVCNFQMLSPICCWNQYQTAEALESSLKHLTHLK